MWLKLSGKEALEEKVYQLQGCFDAFPWVWEAVHPLIADFLHTTLQLHPQQQLPSMQAGSPQPCCDASLPSPEVGALSLLLVPMPKRTSAAFSPPQPVAASSTTFTSAMVAPASITMTSRRRQCPHRQHALQQLESSDCVFAPHVFSIEEIKSNTDLQVYGL